MNTKVNTSSFVAATMRLLAAAGLIACACLTQAQSNVPLVPMGAVWKYLDTGVDQGPAWIAPAFNDNSPDLSFNLAMATNVGIPVPGMPEGPFVERQVLGFNVRLVATPPSGVTNYLVREKPPFGQPGNISHGGSYDPATRTILFGPFDDGQSRTLTYADSPPDGSYGRFVFTGEAAANRTSSAVVGDDYTEIPRFPPPLDVRLLLRWRPLSQQVAIQLIGGSGSPCFILASTNLQDWISVGDLGSVFQGFELVDSGVSNHPCRFYRAQNIPVPQNPDPVELVWIPPGTFTMGSPAGEVDREPDEGPQTLVTLTRGFLMGRYEVTQGEYLAVMGGNPSYFKGDTNRPVERVNWADATNYCAQLTAQERTAGRLPTGWVYRLPTEAEWEYSCRAGTTTRFYHGNDAGYTQLRNYAWYGGYSGNTTHPVGGKLSNPWGLYDMSGNVGEWCLDAYADSLSGGSVTDPQGPALGAGGVVRGGDWGNIASDCRSANRDGYGRTIMDEAIGFRVVLALSQP